MSGTIREIGIFQTRLRDPANVEIIVPNAARYNSPISNVSTHPTRRIGIQIGIDYRDEIQNAKTLIEQIFAAEHRVLKVPGAGYFISCVWRTQICASKSNQASMPTGTSIPCAHMVAGSSR